MKVKAISAAIVLALSFSAFAGDYDEDGKDDFSFVSIKQASSSDDYDIDYPIPLGGVVEGGADVSIKLADGYISDKGASISGYIP